MDIPINARVNCKDGQCGHVTHVVLIPTTERITHLVVSNESYPVIEFLVSIDHVVKSTSNMILLDCSNEDLSKMPVFDRVFFVPSVLSGFSGDPYMMWPYAIPEINNIRLEKEHIPADELIIHRGARVESTDGSVGRVDEFLINPENDLITHLVLREGHLWGQKDVTIPVSQIDHYHDNTVYLKLDKQAIGMLQTVPIRRGSVKK
jgi:sporulation protein YlmC with PRC-barrel domain